MSEDQLFQQHVSCRRRKLLEEHAETGVEFEPYGEERQVMNQTQEREAKTVEGTFDEPAGPRKNYQDNIRVAYFRGEGRDDQSIAERLRLPLGFVQACKNPGSIPIPKQVPQYIADHGLRCLEHGIEPFRPAVLRRNFVNSSPGVLKALSSSLNWVAAPALKRDYVTGEVWDTGHRLLREKASCGLHTGVPAVDTAIAKIVEEYQIDDPGAYLLCNRYADGRAFIAPHQHDFWSATFSFGAPRVFILGQRALILQDGDVLVFGSQRHSVPKMPTCTGERISLSLFWYPNWRADCGHTEEQIERWHRGSEEAAMWAAKRTSSVEMLTQLGFEVDVIVAALNDSGDDVDAAAVTLLAKGCVGQNSADQVKALVEPEVADATAAPLLKPKNRWRNKK
eukprot:TRINITY_DN74666_c0_g1_i1.p1 TRINITY_DN74666_c0_g1~~TRINITY_DN74666_c0_g1_i1.p1  ORF type:complete len:394 (+),score=57.06 TRINITY_DN74666_c0_g1_i1:2-1183(+)